jgi:hypothetical protein
VLDHGRGHVLIFVTFSTFSTFSPSPEHLRALGDQYPRPAVTEQERDLGA